MSNMADDDSKKPEEIEVVEESSSPHETPDVSETDAPETDEQIEAPAAPVQKIEVKDPSKPSFKEKLKAFLHTKKGKVITIIAAVVLVVAILLAIPFTRYAIAGVVIKKDVTFTVLDQDSKKPVINQRDRAVLQFPSRIGLRVNVADFLELERTLERNRKFSIATDIESVFVRGVFLGKFLSNLRQCL